MAVQMCAALFGEGSSVYGFARWNAFLEAAPRRLMQLLWAMYVDDGRLIDLAGAKGAGQNLIASFFEELGTPLAPAKHTSSGQQVPWDRGLRSHG